MGRISETLTFEEVVELNRQQIAAYGGSFYEPDNCRNKGSLSFALETIDGSSFGVEHYPHLSDKAAHLAFTIIRSHVFMDGNKRTAISLIRVFLLINGFDIEIQTETIDQAALDIALEVANKKIGRKDLSAWIAKRIIQVY